MATTTISAILERFETLLQSDPLNLQPAGDPFTSMGIAGVSVDRTFRLVVGGHVRDTCQSNYVTARVDRVTVTVQQAMNFDGYQAQRDLQDVLDSIERATYAHFLTTTPIVGVETEKGSRKVTRLKDSDVCEASIQFWVDFDFAEA